MNNVMQLKKPLLVLLLAVVLILMCSCSVSKELLAEKRQETLQYKNRVFTNVAGISAVLDDGTIAISGVFENEVADSASWTDIVQVVHPDDFNIVGLKSDGTVVAAGDNLDVFDVSEWKDITQISCSHGSVYGLKSDGTVLAAGYTDEWNPLRTGGWKGVVKLFPCCYTKATYALTEEGKIITTDEDDMPIVEEWTDVIDFHYQRGCALALRSDGKVYSLGYSYEHTKEIETWEDIIDVVAAGEYGLAAGLKSDGTVVFTGDKEIDGSYDEPSFAEISNWKNVIDIEGSNAYLIGLTSDGKVLFAGRNGSTRNSAFNTSRYSDCVAIYAGDPSFLALKKDGTLEGYVNTSIDHFPPLWDK